jgi:hypothetical protein
MIFTGSLADLGLDLYLNGPGRRARDTGIHLRTKGRGTNYRRTVRVR